MGMKVLLYFPIVLLETNFSNLKKHKNQITNLKRGMSKPYHLEERTFLFAKNVRDLVYKLQYSIANNEDVKQVVRSSGSVAANYIEANEHLSGKDFDYRAKICRKEAKETVLWLNLLTNPFNSKFENEIKELASEAEELKKIFSAIIEKRKKSK